MPTSIIHPDIRAEALIWYGRKGRKVGISLLRELGEGPFQNDLCIEQGENGFYLIRIWLPPTIAHSHCAMVKLGDDEKDYLRVVLVLNIVPKGIEITPVFERYENGAIFHLPLGWNSWSSLVLQMLGYVPKIFPVANPGRQPIWQLALDLGL